MDHRLELEEMSREELIKHFFHEKFSYINIAKALKKFNFDLSERQIKRILHEMGLKRRNMNENFEEITLAIIAELEGSGSCLGYKSMWRRLQGEYKISVCRETVMELLRILDPEGVQERCRYRLKRRLYRAPGPNFIYHIDGYDKLLPYGFAIHGAIDGYSRKIMWLALATTNKKPQVVCHYYLKTVQKLKKLPTLIRSDHGTENSIVQWVHKTLRSVHDDKFAKNCFLKGKSTANQRVESSWCRMRRHSVHFWIEFFKKMIADGEFEKTNRLQVEALRYCFGPLIQYDLDLTRREWNSHHIRKQKHENIIPGQPNFLFHFPNANEVEDCGHPVINEHIDNAMLNFAQDPKFVSTDMINLVNGLFDEVELPTNAQGAKLLYHKILQEIAQIEE